MLNDLFILFYRDLLACKVVHKLCGKLVVTTLSKSGILWNIGLHVPSILYFSYVQVADLELQLIKLCVYCLDCCHGNINTMMCLESRVNGNTVRFYLADK